MGPIVITRKLNLFYTSFQALINIDMAIEKHKITALIGPSGCGKTTLLRVFNRMNDLIDGVRVDGQVMIDGDDIFAPQIDMVRLRKKVGMVFQRPNPFALSVEENILFGVKIHQAAPKSEYGRIVEESLRAVDLWDVLKDKLNYSALNLSLEVQQRLCIARLLPVKPDILLMDEPCSALDPISTSRVEELIFELKKNYTIIIVTHNMQQAARVSDFTAFLYLGELIEFGPTQRMFTVPQDKRTEAYLTGRYG